MSGWGRNSNVKPKARKKGLFNIKDSLQRTLRHLGFHMKSALLYLAIIAVSYQPRRSRLDVHPRHE